MKEKYIYQNEERLILKLFIMLIELLFLVDLIGVENLLELLNVSAAASTNGGRIVDFG